MDLFVIFPLLLWSYFATGTSISQTKCVEYGKMLTTKKTVDDAASTAFPFMVQIYTNISNTKQFLNGVLISENFVLSTASGIPESSRLVVMRRELRSGAVTSKTYDVIETFVHPNFNADNLSSNIKLFKLNESIKFDDSVQSACLPPFDLSTTEDVVQIGTSDINGNAIDYLCNIKSKIISNESCKTSYESAGASKFVSDIGNGTIFCARPEIADRQTCDSYVGSALISVNQNGSATIMGLAAYSLKYFDDDTATIFVRVSAFIDWIETIVWRGETVSETNTTTAKAEIPVSKTNITTDVKPNISVSNIKSNTIEPKIRLSETNTTKTKPDIPVSETNTTTVKPQIPVTETKTTTSKTETAVSKTNITIVVEPNLSVSGIKSNTIEPEINVSETNTTTAKPEVNVSEMNTNTTKPEINVSEMNTTTAKPEISDSKTNTTTTKPEIPVSEKNTNTTKPEINVSETNTTTAVPEIPVSKTNPTTAKPAIPVIEANTTTTKPESPASETNTTTDKPEIPDSKTNTTTDKPEISDSKTNTITARPAIPVIEATTTATKPETSKLNFNTSTSEISNDETISTTTVIFTVILISLILCVSYFVYLKKSKSTERRKGHDNYYSCYYDNHSELSALIESKV